MNKSNTLFANKFPCDLQSIWKSPSPLYAYSMYMEKNSPLTPFIAQKLRKYTELGVKNILLTRSKDIDPNCKPILSKGNPLSFEKIGSLFALFFTFILVALLILVSEKMIFHYLPQELSAKFSDHEGIRIDIQWFSLVVRALDSKIQ